MSLSTQSSKVRIELLPGYPDIFEIMFDSVNVEGPPVEVEEVSEELDSDFSDDDQDDD